MAQRKAKRPTISDQLREAIAQSELTRYEIWKRSGVDQGALSRFVNGKQSLTLDIVDKLADVLGLKLVSNLPKAKDR
ncbi:MAG TPA: helix-turn-helix transcriptional regulator [Pirellulales bacterium]|jgi:plasmid maintenance system antidote protein VapI|nr:helix-turn-helix transcriptional regulator [Pirellulales bacterium]